MHNNPQQKNEERDPARVPALIDNRDGTYTVLRCSNKEKPEGFRRIIRRFDFKSRPKALALVDALSGRSS